ncbi:hypothetical protein F4823DRAFT_561729 [Ustulina deusta]|nr:hypothetical protein F4823DRAFT_561729 [Ustulina deusta]
MSPSQHRQATSRLTNIITTLLLLIAVVTASPTTKAAEGSHTFHRRQEMSVGSSCDGSEGQWNCMTSSFQRCGSGQWSEVQQCALGTQCSPAGLTYEFHVDFAGYLGAAPPPTTSGGGSGSGSRGAPVNGWLSGGVVVIFVLWS